MLNSSAMRDARTGLTGTVEQNMSEIDFDDGELDIDDDFIYYQNGVYCLIFLDNGELIRGYSPYDSLLSEPFSDQEVRQVIANGETYYIYDRMISFSQSQIVWIRGIISQSSSSVSQSAILITALIAFPLLIALASIGGFLLAKRSLRPIQQIRQTAEEIGTSGNLSKRIETNGNTNDELYQLALTFNHMFDRLEANFETKKQFTSDASHELRTPVSVILAQCEYALENTTDIQELYQALNSIQRQGRRMSKLIDSLLDFTRIEQNTCAIKLQNINLSLLIEGICNEQRELGVKGISLTESIQPSIEMYADPDLLSRMLINLIQNAYRYGLENGHIKVFLRSDDNNIILSVADDGIGISADELDKIFNRFYRADKSRNITVGAGLGLSIVKQIVRLHNGNIKVDSNPGTGSTFTVYFPKH